MDVIGILNYQIKSVTYAAKSGSVLSPFAAGYPFFNTWFKIDLSEELIFKAAYTTNLPHTSKLFSWIRDSFSDLLSFIYCSFQT